MTRIEASISTRLDTDIDQLVEQGEFLNRQEAVSELLSVGLQTYQIDSADEEEGELEFADEMMNPGDRPMGPEDEDEGGDEYTF